MLALACSLVSASGQDTGPGGDPGAGNGGGPGPGGTVTNDYTADNNVYDLTTVANQTVSLGWNNTGPVSGGGPKIFLQNGSIVGTGSLVLDFGPRSMILLVGANSFTGPVYLNGLVAADGNFGGSGNPLVLNGGTLMLGVDPADLTTSTAQSVALVNPMIVSSAGGTIALDAGRTLTLAGVVSGAGAWSTAGQGLLTLSNNGNDFTGTLTLGGGTLALGGTGVLGSTAGISFGGGTLQFSAANTTDYSARFSGADNQAYNIDTNGQNVTFASALTSSGGTLTKSGAGTLVLTGANTFSGLTTLSAGTLQLGDGGTSGSLGSGAIVNNGTLVIDRRDAFTLSGAISGTGGISLIGGGTLTLAGANSSTGDTLLTNGTLRAGADGAFSGGSLVQMSAGTTLDLAGYSESVAGINGSGTIALGGGALTTLNLAANVFSGAITGSGTFEKQGAAPMALSGANTFSGTLLVTAGLLRTDAANTLSPNAGVAIASGGTLGLNSFSQAIGGLSGAGTLDLAGATLTVNQATDATFSGSISTGTLAKSGNGTLTLSGIGTFDGTFSASAGTLALGNVDGSGTIALAGGSVIDLTNSANVFSGAITGSGTFEKQGAAPMALSGANTFAGTFTVTEGLLRTDALNTLSPNAAVSVATGATLGLNDFSQTAGGLSGAGSVVLGSATLTLNQASNTNFSGTITGAGAISKSGTGTLTLSGANDYAGGTTVTGGTLQIDADARLGTGTVILAGGALRYGAAFDDLRAITLGAGGGTLDTNGNDVAVSSTIGGVGSLSKVGGGTLTLSGVNSYSGGTTLGGGVLAVSSDANLGGAAGAVAFGGGTLQIATGFTADRATSLGSGGGTFDVASGQTVAWDGAIIGSAGNALTKLGTGTLILGGANTYAGNTNVNVGTLQLGAGNAFSPGTQLTVASGATFDANGFAPTLSGLSGAGTVNVGTAGITVAASGASTFPGTLTGAGGLSKSGGGTLQLTGMNSYSGPTSITGGELKLNGSAANSAFTIGSGGTLSGNGSVGALTISSGGTLSPGNSPGRIDAGNTSWEGGSTFKFELNNAAGAAGTNWDLLAVTGSLTITATGGNKITLDLTSLNLSNAPGAPANFAPGSNYSFVIATTTGGISGFSANDFSFDPSAFGGTGANSWSIAQVGDNLELEYTGMSAVPEPSTYGLISGIAALGMAVLRRRKPRPAGFARGR